MGTIDRAPCQTLLQKIQVSKIPAINCFGGRSISWRYDRWIGPEMGLIRDPRSMQRWFWSKEERQRKLKAIMKDKVAP